MLNIFAVSRGELATFIGAVTPGNVINSMLQSIDYWNAVETVMRLNLLPLFKAASKQVICFMHTLCNFSVNYKNCFCLHVLFFFFNMDWKMLLFHFRKLLSVTQNQNTFRILRILPPSNRKAF